MVSQAAQSGSLYERLSCNDYFCCLVFHGFSTQGFDEADFKIFVFVVLGRLEQ